MADGEVKVVISGDSSQLVAESGRGIEALKIFNDEAHAAGQNVTKVGQSASDAAPAVEKLAGHSRELHRVASLMNRILPGSGEAIKALGHSGDGTALMLIGLVASIELITDAFKKMEAGAKAADEALALSMSEGGSLDAINAQKKAWQDAEIAEEMYHHNAIQNEEDMVKRIADAQVEILKKKHESAAQETKDEIAIREQELKIKQGQAASVAADETSAAAKYKGAAGALAKHDKAVETYTGNIATAKEAAKATGVTDEDAQDIREAYEAISGKPSSGGSAPDLGAQADYVRNHVTMGTFAVPEGEQLHLLNMFSDFAGGRGLNDASFATYALAQGDIRRNQGQLTAENAKDQGLRENEQMAKSDLEAARKTQTEFNKSIVDLTRAIELLKGIAPAFPSPTGPPIVPPANARGAALFDENQLIGAHNILAAGGTLDSNQTAMIQNILKFATGHAVSQDKILSVLNTLVDTPAHQQDLIDELFRKINDLSSRTPPKN